ncbi:hypothetical protein PUNSTDRAFT_141290 [Punctularia strigosozonata HHB-11173 SS5]|uniref:uncharacterized protein n=1 Tax=Punctularia strigosozonata (strain HHB-11173) TaxID=741275 RepID=UPI0004416E34|nr:uncharacterized protein PUNSTDRAFT_141290 [Punctularia strigosozonata HHB-11173 SS5]EIN12639.1 hypothetical protein PUNSTDRAFT_141290 [Punctularia strigosozonata HHB-11173 SS5]
MPLDGHEYLVAQGWKGKGTALREGAISRPIAVTQKKNLGGVGKDRDEAFPFWDHLFAAAASAITLKVDDSDEDADDSYKAGQSTPLEFTRTSTGILSNRRPVSGTPASASLATSGTSTPDAHPDTPRMSLMATAKREAAKRGLYSRFFRGPVLGPETAMEPTMQVEQEKPIAMDVEMDHSTTVIGHAKEPVAKEQGPDEAKRKKRKRGGEDGSGNVSGSNEVVESSEGREWRREEKPLGKDQKKDEKARRKEEKRRKKEAKARASAHDDAETEDTTTQSIPTTAGSRIGARENQVTRAKAAKRRKRNDAGKTATDERTEKEKEEKPSEKGRVETDDDEKEDQFEAKRAEKNRRRAERAARKEVKAAARKATEEENRAAPKPKKKRKVE